MREGWASSSAGRAHDRLTELGIRKVKFWETGRLGDLRLTFDDRLRHSLEGSRNDKATPASTATWSRRLTARAAEYRRLAPHRGAAFAPLTTYPLDREAWERGPGPSIDANEPVVTGQPVVSLQGGSLRGGRAWI